jgi:hypothetical protein
MLTICEYENKLEAQWDDFVINKSINGTFLQTRRFLNYHPEGRFIDRSLVFYKGNTIVAVIPACELFDEHKKTFFSHKGSTYGGIIIGRDFYNIKHVGSIIFDLEAYLVEQGFTKVIIKNTADIFCKDETKLLEYFLFKENYQSYDELSFYIDFNLYKDDIISNLSASKRRDYKYSLKNNLAIRELLSKTELESFYNILEINLCKFAKTPVHSLAELIDMKVKRLGDIACFYGVYMEKEMIAGSMVFNFDNEVFHTQYLASNPEYLSCYPMDFLIVNLIKYAYDKNFKYMSFGISTENNGKFLNEGLARFKEGFGCKYAINKTFYKDINTLNSYSYY